MFLQWKIDKMLTLMFLLAFSSAVWGQAAEATSTYSVAPSDTLWQIARRHSTSVSELMSANKLTGSLILPGQLIRIPVHTVSHGDTMWGIGALRYQPFLIACGKPPNIARQYLPRTAD